MKTPETPREFNGNGKSDSKSSKCNEHKKVKDLNELIQECRQIFSSDNVDIDQVQNLLYSYQSNPKDWKKYAHFDRHRYTRNLVDTGNGKYNLMLLAWSEGQGSSIHDHANSHCFMKVLSGTLTETRFAWPQADSSAYPSKDSYSVGSNGSKVNGEETESKLDGGGGMKEISQKENVSKESENEQKEESEEKEMKVILETDIRTNDVTYMSDSLGLHRVENKSHVLPAVSLHLYVPPYESCRAFDQRTGHAMKCNITFYSKNGKKVATMSGKRSNGKLEDNGSENIGGLFKPEVIKYE